MKRRYRNSHLVGLLLAAALGLVWSAEQAEAAVFRRSHTSPRHPASTTVTTTRITAADPLSITVFLPLTLNTYPPNAAPYTPSSPSPSDASCTCPSGLALTWAGGDPNGDPVAYSIYLEANDPTPDALAAETTVTAYNLGTLAGTTHYYWQITATDSRGATTVGPVWEFTTEEITTDDAFATEVVALTNQERAGAGCSALNVSVQLTAAAVEHSTDMAHNDYFSHTSLDGQTPWDRIKDTGYVYTRAAENIAAGYSSPTAVVQGWMESDGHRANILNCDLTEIGVGYVYLANDTGAVNYHHYWTQVFATPAQ